MVRGADGFFEADLSFSGELLLDFDRHLEQRLLI
jgi:hypothetical protein